jgi:hypothetical protein
VFDLLHLDGDAVSDAPLRQRKGAPLKGQLCQRERLAERGPLRGFVGTVSKAIDLIGQYQDAGAHLLINSDYRNDIETHELFASDVMPHFV